MTYRPIGKIVSQIIAAAPTTDPADGTLWVDAGVLKVSVAPSTSGEVLTMSHTTGSHLSATQGDHVFTDGTDFTSGSASGTGLVLTLTVDGSGVSTLVVTDGGQDYLDTDTVEIGSSEMAAVTGGTWIAPPTFDILTVS